MVDIYGEDYDYTNEGAHFVDKAYDSKNLKKHPDHPGYLTKKQVLKLLNKIEMERI